MSLTVEQVIKTKKEFRENIEILGYDISKIARDLKTTEIYLEKIINLNVRRIEDPWILKNYLEKEAKDQAVNLLPFTALVGDYHKYWFLNPDIIDKKYIELGEE